MRAVLSGSDRACSDFGFLPCAAGCRGCGKVGILPLDFHFPTARSSSASVVYKTERNKRLVGAASGRASLLSHPNRGGIGDSVLQARNSLALATPNLRADSVSLISPAIRSNCARLIPAFRFRSTSGSDFNFSYGVA